VYATETQRLTLPKGATMQGTILVYGNEPILVSTRELLLRQAGYKVFTAQTFANAMLAMMNSEINVCILCHSLTDEELRAILEMAHVHRPQLICVVLDFEEIKAPIEGVDLIRGIVRPSTLLNAIAKTLTQKASIQTSAS
jgi:DNA-binding NtrC family response regulator